LGEGSSGYRFITIWRRPRPTFVPSFILIHPAVWLQQTWTSDCTDACKACARKFRRWKVAVPLSVGQLNLHLTQCGRGPRPNCVPSFILIRPTVWPQCTNVTDRTGQRYDSIGESFYKRSPKNRDAQKKRASHNTVESVLSKARGYVAYVFYFLKDTHVR